MQLDDSSGATVDQIATSNELQARSAKAAPLPARLRSILCLDDFEPAAERHLPAPIFGYVASAAERNSSLRANRLSFERFDFVPRVLVDVARRTTATHLLGQSYAAPFGIAPMGLCALTAYRGDIVLAQAAAQENVPMIVSGASLIRLEDVARANPGAWFQAYLPGDDARIAALLERVQRAGYKTLVVTVDTPVPANRESNVRAGFSTPLRPSLRLAWQGLTRPRWLFGTLARTVLQHGMPHFENSAATRGAPIISPTVERDFAERSHLSWHHFRRVRELWPGLLVIKGVLHAQDARMAVDAGADGVIVSNHGGRQLDGSIPPLTVLPQIVAACPDTPVMLDSGVRRGSDVLKALALGAKFVFVGRPFVYAAAIGGQAAVRKGIELLKLEISRNLGLLGVTSATELDETFLFRNSTA
jgi:L-lactate dehydrogenase (cytochrome)